jgi:hypothetical protein
MSEAENSDVGADEDGGERLADPTSTEVPSRRFDLLITLTMIVVSLVFLALSQQFAGIRTSEFDPGAAFWPRAALVLIVLASLVNLRHIYVEAKADGEVSELLARPETFNPVEIFQSPEENDRLLLGTMVLFVVYVAAVEPLGFLFATPPFLLLVSWLNGYRKPVRLVAFSLLTALLFFVIFANLNIALPRGIEPFRGVAIWVENNISFSL